MKTLPVLMYHQVCGDEIPQESEFIVSQRVFLQQMSYLAERGYFTPRLSQLLAGTYTTSESKKKPVLITFDDGYANNYEYAFPILREIGFSALISLVADRRFHTNLWDRTKGIPRANLMSPEQIVEMAAHGIEFGSHSHSHTSLPSLNDEDLDSELRKSKETIESIVGQQANFIAYPYGDVDERVKRAVRNAGYSCAFATHTGPLDFRTDPFEIRRILVLNRADQLYLYAKSSGLNKTYMWGKWFAKSLLGRRNKFQYELTNAGADSESSE